MNTARSRGAWIALSLLYAASGFGTLALETLWIREITLRVGSTLVAASLVVGTFFLSAAAGNLFGASLAARLRRPLAGYGWLEMGAAASALGLFQLTRSPWFPGGGMVLAALLVALPSFLSGASFPLLSEHLVRNPNERVSGGGVLYGANLLGAATGVLAGAVVLPWFWGMGGAFLIAGIVLMMGGAVALVAAGRWVPCRAAVPCRRDGDRRQGIAALQEDNSHGSSKVFTLLVFILCGAFSLAAQGLLLSWVRQILQGSVYALSGVLASFIFGLGAGSLLAAGLRRRGIHPANAFSGMALATALLLILVPMVGSRLVVGIPPQIGTEPLEMLGFTTCWSLVFLLPLTLCLGTLFPLAWEMWGGGDGHEGRALGQIIAANKLGASLGVGLGVFVFLPAFGLQGGTCFLGLMYVLLAVAVLWGSLGMGGSVVGESALGGPASKGCPPKAEARPLQKGIALALAIAVFGIIRMALSHPAMGLEEGENVRATYQGPYGPVSVIDSAVANSRRIVLNTRQRLNGTGRALSAQHHEAWIPLFFAESVDHVAAIGMASGITADAVLDFPVRKLDAMELIPGVVRAAREHFQPWNSRLFSDPRVHLLLGDGRQVLRTREEPYDVVICDLLFPQEDGSSNLYSLDFFQEVRDRLKPGGLFCLWLPCYQLDDRSLGILAHTFGEVFPETLVVRANFDPQQPVIGLIGSQKPIPLGREVMKEKLSRLAAGPHRPESPFFLSPDHAWLAVVGRLQPGQSQLGNRPVTRDDRPLMAYLGPADLGNGGRLVGMTFAKWINQCLDSPVFAPSQTGGTPPAEILASVQAARAYYIAAVADSVIEGDKRPDSVRMAQTARWLGVAQKANPAAVLPPEALGR